MSKHRLTDLVTAHRPAKVLVARPEGQMGNRIFQAAAFQAAAWEMGFRIWNSALFPYAETHVIASYDSSLAATCSSASIFCWRNISLAEIIV